MASEKVEDVAQGSLDVNPTDKGEETRRTAESNESEHHYLRRGADEILQHKLYVGNLDRRLTEYHILKILQRFGTIKYFNYLFFTSGPKSGQPRGYCFVEYSNRLEAETALAGLQGRLALGRPLRVAWAQGRGPALEDTDEDVGFSAPAPQPTVASTAAKIQAIEAKLQLMEGGKDVVIGAAARPRNWRATAAPYDKKSRFRGRGRGSYRR